VADVIDLALRPGGNIWSLPERIESVRCDPAFETVWRILENIWAEARVDYHARKRLCYDWHRLQLADGKLELTIFPVGRGSDDEMSGSF
jgi:hypothetical protein